jgi:hypothetical protein
MVPQKKIIAVHAQPNGLDRRFGGAIRVHASTKPHAALTLVVKAGFCPVMLSASSAALKLRPDCRDMEMKGTRTAYCCCYSCCCHYCCHCGWGSADAWPGAHNTQTRNAQGNTNTTTVINHDP